MAELLTIKLSDIHVPERLREVDPAHAMLIADSFQRQGLIHPITVRRTPNAKGGKFTLVAGAHRMEAARLSGWTEIEVIKVDGDAQAARLTEIEENLFRHDLVALDRAVFVTEFRKLFEAEHGEIKRGGDRKSDQTADTAVWSENSAIGSFMKVAMDRIGMSERSLRSYQRVGLNLDPNLRKRLHGTPEADNLSLLTKLVDMGPEKQAGVARAMDAPDTDLKAAMAAASPEKPQLSEREKIKSSLVDRWHRAHKKDREWFLIEIGLEPELAKSLAAEKAGAK